MNFALSTLSLNRLDGVNTALALVVRRAIQLSTIDFGVTEGLRTLERQKELVRRGLSQTLKSKHLTGDAVDLVAYYRGRVCWELNVYDDVAEAMQAAAEEHQVPIRWGGAWSIPDITKWQGTMEEAMNAYIDLRRSQGRRPFIDAPHFELVDDGSS